MPAISSLKENLFNGSFDAQLKSVYVTDEAIKQQYQRYSDVAESFIELFGKDREVSLLSAPGRTEICGNHTDHNFGKVLAGAVNLDAIAVASKNDSGIIRVKSAGYDMDEIDISDLEVHKEQYGKSVSLLRGICADFKKLGYNIGGFDATTESSVMSGSGLSSSAAYEVLICTILNHLYNDGKIDDVTIAKISQFAENEYFGKPCGLLDQMASSVGSMVTIDFEAPEKPLIEKIDLDFSKFSHALCIVDTGGNHSDLTDDYAAVRQEMESVAEFFGKKVLRQVDEKEFYKAIPEIRQKLGDRAVLRAIHFYNENHRVDDEISAIKKGDFEEFKRIVIESGESSFKYNQNIYSNKFVAQQPIALALNISEKILKGKGAYRVHGGGFAGTIQAFVPFEKLDEYKAEMERIFGKGKCYVLSIRPVGGAKIV
ncbi:MAG: galactokinase [Clostridiales bacterium]|nr:galactokinase [Clostridiales bacterium]